MIRDNDFKFYVPANIVKASDGTEADGEMVLEGIASTSHVDNQNESLLPEGFDYSYLLNSGYVNWHHQLAKNPMSVIGEPTEAKITKAGLYLKAILYKDNQMAKDAYELAGILEKNSKTRRMGWSIEGKVIERDKTNPSKILKARITGVALTPMPINPYTLVNIVKAFDGEDLIEEEVEKGFEGDANGGDESIVNITLSDGGTVRVYKNGKIDLNLNKSMNTTVGAPIMRESLEGKLKKTCLNKAEAIVEIMERYPNMSYANAKMTCDKIIKHSKK